METMANITFGRNPGTRKRIDYICIMQVIKNRDYKEEYRRYGKSEAAKKYRAGLNRINRRKGNYGNGDGLDEAHIGTSDKTELQPESQNRANNRPRRRRSRSRRSR